MKTRSDLNDLSRDLKKSVEELIRISAEGHLTIHVIADDWPGKTDGDDGKDSDIKINGSVDLLPDDLEKSLNAGSTHVTQVRLPDGTVVTLNEKREIMRGDHFVMPEERDRLQRLLQLTHVASGDDLPGYLDPSHYYYSETLDAAVQAWTALFGSGDFMPGKASREQIDGWLSKTFKTLKPNARSTISTVVNPNRLKRQKK